MSEAGSLRVDVEGNASGFAQTMNTVKQHARQAAGEINTGLSKSWGGIGKGIVGGIVGALSFQAVKGSFDAFLNKAKYIKDLSEQMEMGAESTQKWERAADALGLSFGGMQSVLTAIAQKRQEALSDPKAAGLFERLGIARDAVRNTAGVDESEFAKMVLNAGRQGDDSRAALGEIVGRRGLKYAAAAGEYDQAEAPISDADIRMADSYDRTQKRVQTTAQRFWSKLLASIGGVGDEVERLESKPRSGGFSLKAGLQGVMGLFSGRTELGGGGAALPLTRTTPRKKGESALGPDLAKEAEDRKRQELADQVAESEQRIEQAKRAHMNEKAKRVSQEKELAALDARIQKSKSEAAPGDLKGMALEEWKAKQTVRTNALIAEREGLAGQMKDGLRQKLLSLPVDALTKSGLVTPGGANFANSAGTEKAQLDVLRSIDRKIAANNPWKL